MAHIRVMGAGEASERRLIESDGEETSDLNNTVKFALTPLVALSSVISFCRSLSVGYAAGFSSPIESQIMQDLGLSLLSQYSTFGSMLTVGGMISAVETTLNQMRN